MMIFSSEVWLLLAAAGLYLADQVVLLGRSEVLLVRAEGRWKGIAARGFWKLAGRSVHWVGPLMPWRLAFRLNWQADPSVVYRPSGLDLRGSQLAPLQIGATGLGLLLFVVMPLTGWRVGLGSVFLAEIVIAYVIAVAMVGWLAVRRNELGLPDKVWRSMSADVLLCLPFAVNLPSRVSRAIVVSDDALGFAMKYMDSLAQKAFLHDLRAVVDEWLDYAPDETQEWRNAAAYSAFLQQYGQQQANEGSGHDN